MSRENLLDKSLDEIIGDSKSARAYRGSSSEHRRRGSRGVSKSFRGRRGGTRIRRIGDSYVPREQSLLNKEVEEITNGKPYLKVSNLNVELTEADINQLFSQLGEVTLCRVDFDTQGNSKGIAYVAFLDSNNNELAVDKFDGRRAAGQVITVKEISKERGPNPLAERISLGERKRPLSAPKQKKKTAEELDAELDNYFQSTDDGNNHMNGDPSPAFPAV